MPLLQPALLDHVHRLLAPQDSDAELLGNFTARRDEAAFAALVRRHGPMVLRLCRRLLGEVHAAEDCFQATFLALARQAGSIRRPAAVAAWLYGVAYRVALKTRAERGRRRAVASAVDVATCPDPRPEPLDQLSGREVIAAFEEEMQRLPESYRLPIALCCLEGLSLEEAAHRLGWTRGAVKGRLERGRTRLHARLVRRGLTLSAALAVAEAARGLATATLPAALLSATVPAALAFAGASPASATVVPAAAARLAGEALRGTGWSRRLLPLALVVGVGLAVLGADPLARPAPGDPAAPSAESQEPKANSQEGPAAGSRPLAPGFGRTDRFGDPLPPGAVARMGTVRFRIGTTVNAVAWAPSGKLVAAAGEARFIHIWDAVSGKEVVRLPTLAIRVHCLAFSPDGKWLAATGDHTAIHLWDTSLFGKQDKPRQFTGPESSATHLTFAPDNKTLYSCSSDGFIRVWDVATGRSLRHFGGPPLTAKGGQWSASIALDPDGTLLVSRDMGRDGNGFQTVAATLWNVATGKRIRRFGKTERATSFPSTYAVGIAPDGRTVAAVTDDGIKIWNTYTGAEVVVLKGRAERMAFARDGASLYTRNDDRICQWAVPSGRLLRSFEVERHSSSPIALSPDGKTLATGRLAVGLWDVETGKRRHALSGHHDSVWSLFFTGEGKELVTVGDGSPIHRWDLEGRRLDAWKPPGNCYWLAAQLSPDGKTLAVQNNNRQVLLFDSLTGKVRQSFNNHQDKKWRQDARIPMHFAFSPDSRRVVSAASGVDQHVRLWEADTAREIWNVRTGKPDTLIQGFALSPDGQTMYLTSDPGPVKVYEVGKASGVVSGGSPSGVPHGSPPVGVVSGGSPSGVPHGSPPVGVVSGGSPSGVPHGSPPSGPGQAQRQIGDAKAVIRSLCLSRDGRRLAGAARDHIFIWDTATGAEVCRLPRPQVSELYNRRFLKFSPDGRMLAIWTGDEPTVRCLEIASGQVRLETTGHLESVLGVEFSADGRHLATGGTDTTALLWDLRALALVGDTARNVDTERLWSELAALDARVAHRAVVRLQEVGHRAVIFLADRLKPAANQRPLAACLAELDDETFRVRERATEELMGRSGDRGELAKALAATMSVEVRSRLQRILGRLGDYDPRKDVRRLQSLRGLETLEGIDTPQARRIVETLARGAPEAELTREAAATLKRLR